ncbi:3058_t:CDS:2, partial [Gigaspora rosea]
QQICEQVAQMTKKGGGKCKTTTIKQTIDRINRYLKEELGEKEVSIALTVQQIKEILDNEFLNPKTFEAYYIDKNNQQGIQEGIYNKFTSIDPPGTFGPVSYFVNYISKPSSDAPIIAIFICIQI